MEIYLIHGILPSGSTRWYRMMMPILCPNHTPFLSRGKGDDSFQGVVVAVSTLSQVCFEASLRRLNHNIAMNTIWYPIKATYIAWPKSGSFFQDLCIFLWSSRKFSPGCNVALNRCGAHVFQIPELQKFVYLCLLYPSAISYEHFVGC